MTEQRMTAEERAVWWLTHDELRERLRAVEAERDAAVKAIRTALGDIGVPQPDYPATIAHAYDTLTEALAQLAEVRA